MALPAQAEPSPDPAVIGRPCAGRRYRSIRHPLSRTLLLLTFRADLLDAAGFLGLGHVFTADIAGNVVLLGLCNGGRIAQIPERDAGVAGKSRPLRPHDCPALESCQELSSVSSSSAISSGKRSVEAVGGELGQRHRRRVARPPGRHPGKYRSRTPSRPSMAATRVESSHDSRSFGRRCNAGCPPRKRP